MSTFDILAACTCSIVYTDPEPNAPSDFYRTDATSEPDYDNQQEPADDFKGTRRPPVGKKPNLIRKLRKKVSWADEKSGQPLSIAQKQLPSSLKSLRAVEPETERHLPQRVEPLESANVELFAAATRLAELPLGIVLIRLRALAAPAKTYVFAPDNVAGRIQAAGATNFTYDEAFVFTKLDRSIFVSVLFDLCGASGITNQALLRATTATLEKLSFTEIADLLGPKLLNRNKILSSLISAAGPNKKRKLVPAARLLDAVPDDADRRAIVAKALLTPLRSTSSLTTVGSSD